MTDFVNVHCVTRVRCDVYDESTANCSFLMPNSRINLSKINEYFPYEGQFHFRIRSPGYKLGFNDIDYVWIDVNDYESHDFLSESNILMQANIIQLPESDPNDSEADMMEYFVKIKSGFEQMSRYDKLNLFYLLLQGQHEHCLSTLDRLLFALQIYSSYAFNLSCVVLF